MNKQSDYMKGLLKAEKDYQVYTNQETLGIGKNAIEQELHKFAMITMKQELDIDVMMALKSQQYLDGVSDYIWNVEYYRGL